MPRHCFDAGLISRLNLLFQAREFLLERLAAGPFPPASRPPKHQLHHEALWCHNGDQVHLRPAAKILKRVRRLDVKLPANHHRRLC